MSKRRLTDEELARLRERLSYRLHRACVSTTDTGAWLAELQQGALDFFALDLGLIAPVNSLGEKNA